MNQLDIYFNTTNLKGDELKATKLKTGKQNAEILELFTLYHYRSFTPAEIWEHFQKQGRNVPLTSVRRAITTLTGQGFLLCTNEMRMGMYGVKNFCWQLK
jgi:Fe2+ or Zn2+ uptake regulation protein